MKTSRQDRLAEYEYLSWRNDAGRLLNREDVLRYVQLYQEFAKPRSNEPKTPESL